MAIPSVGALAPMHLMTLGKSNPLEKLDPNLRDAVAGFTANRTPERTVLIKIGFAAKPSPFERERLNRLGFRVFGEVVSGKDAMEKPPVLLGHLPLSHLKALVQLGAVLSVTEASGYEMYH